MQSICEVPMNGMVVNVFGFGNSIRVLADETICDLEPNTAARELLALLAIQCPTNSYGANKLMSAFIYLHYARY
jgi:hypothetical protein